MRGAVPIGLFSGHINLSWLLKTMKTRFLVSSMLLIDLCLLLILQDLMTGAADSMLSIIQDDATAPADENKVNQVGAGIVSIVGNLFAVSRVVRSITFKFWWLSHIGVWVKIPIMALVSLSKMLYYNCILQIKNKIHVIIFYYHVYLQTFFIFFENLIPVALLWLISSYC